MATNGLETECRRCGEKIQATNGEGLRSKETRHMTKCHPGFTDAEEARVPNPRSVRNMTEDKE